MQFRQDFHVERTQEICVAQLRTTKCGATFGTSIFRVACAGAVAALAAAIDDVTALLTRFIWPIFQICYSCLIG